VEALGNLVGLTHRTLIRPFTLRGVPQAIAQPAPEITPAIDLPTSPAAFQAPQPLPASAELGRRVTESNELIDLNWQAVAILDLVDQAHAARKLSNGSKTN
jgi:hypothetical protein